jgi:hypothetical protein
MKRLRNWFKTGHARTASDRRRPKSSFLEIENLETRLVPATLGVSKLAVLDFDGDSLTAAELSQGGWGNLGATTVSGMTSLFNSDRP